MALVILLHLAVLLLLILQRERAIRLQADTPIVVQMLPLGKPSEAETPQDDLTTEKPRAQAPPVEVARAVAPPDPAPRAPAPVPAPAAAPPAAPLAGSGPIIAGEGDAVFDLDTGSGGGAPGFMPPRWVHKVTNDEFFPLVDEDLLQASLEVDYRMQCTIALDTRVKCRVLREVPFYPGLRRAVLAAVPLLRMAPGRRDGRPIDGQRIEFLWRITVDRGDVRLR